MQELVYALRFRGEARHVGIDGLRGSLHASHGAEAICESELVFNGATSFQEAGTIHF